MTELRGRSLAAAAPAVIVLAAFLLHLVQGLALSGPWLLPDERVFADGAQSLVGPGREGIRTLWSPLVAPFWVAETGTAAALTRVMGAAALALVALLTYALAGLLGAPRAAAIAAGGAAVVSGPALYASALSPAAPAAAAAALGTLAMVRGVGEPSGRSSLAAVAWSLLATALWPALFPLALLAAVAAAVLRMGPTPFLRWPGAAVFVVAAATAYPAYHLGRRSATFTAATDDLPTTLLAAGGSLGILAIGLGLVPAVLAFAVALDPRRPRLLPLLVALQLGALALVVAVRSAGAAAPGDDAPLLAVLPLLLALAASAFGSAGLRRGAVVAASLAVLALAAVAAAADLPLGALASAALSERAGLSPLAFALWGTLLVGVAIAATGLALGSRTATWRLAPRVAATAALPALVATQLLAWQDARRASADLRAALPEPPGRFAAAAEARGILVAGPGTLEPRELETLLFWTPTARLARPPLAERRVAPETGELDPPAPAADLVLVLGPPELAGTVVDSAPPATLLAPETPLRTAETVEGMYEDGWSGPRVVYRRFTPPPTPKLEIGVSRERWQGEYVGGTVRVHVTGPEGRARLAAEFAVPDRAVHNIAIDVPAAPFEIVLEVPTFSPAQFGSADERQLGAQVSFRYLQG